MTETNDTEPTYPELSFELDSKSGILTARFTAAQGKTGLDHDYLIGKMADAGYSDLFMREEAIHYLVQKASREDSGEVEIAEKRDADILITVSDDHMSAFANTGRAYGGKALTREDVSKALMTKGVAEEAFNHAAIERLLSLPSVNKMLVASGKHPVAGKNGRFIWLLKKEETQVHFDNQEGLIDYRAGRTYLVVDQGTPVLRYVPAENGTPGFDIRGHKISATDGKDIKAEKKWEGIERAYHDPNIFVAQYKGHPVNLNPGARIDKSLQFKSVDLKTGHVNFDGSLEISGDIQPGMKVQATGDIFIRGTVESALVESEANIYISGGILGNEQDAEEDVVLPEHFECYIRARCDVHARYVSSSQIYAGHDIHLREYSMHSELYAGNELMLGQEGGKGILLGGQAIVGMAITANQLGNGTYAATQLQVGLSDALYQHYQRMKDAKHELQFKAQTQIDSLQALKKANRDATNLDQDTLKQVYDIKAKINRFKHRAHELNFKLHCFMEMDKPGRRKVSSRKAYPNVQIYIENASRKLENEHNHLALEGEGKTIIDG